MFLRAKDHAMAQAWYNAIQSAGSALLSSAKAELTALQPNMDVKHIGWIIEQVTQIQTQTFNRNTSSGVYHGVCVWMFY